MGFLLAGQQSGSGADVAPQLTSDGYNAPNITVKPDIPGNIDLRSRPMVRGVNGPNSYGTEFSTTYDDIDGPNPGNAVVIPQIYDGKVNSEQDAIARYIKTGEHMGGFNLATEQKTNWQKSEQYSTQLHERPQFLNGKAFRGSARAKFLGGR